MSEPSPVAGSGRGRRLIPYALLALLSLALYLPGIAAIPAFDRDEARFAEASRQMLESGDFVRIRFQNQARDKKPVGIYWLQAASVALFSAPRSRAIWPYRLPSVFGATAAVMLTLALGRRLFPENPHAGPAAAVLLASSLALVAEAHLAKTDAMLLAAVAAAQASLGLVYTEARAGRRPGWGPALVFWIAQAVGMLLKGPVAPVISLLTLASLAVADRDIRWVAGLRPMAGLILAAALVMPWLFAVERATQGRFLVGALGRDLLPKLLGAEESHGAPPGSYLLLLPAAFWPGSLYLVPALHRGWRRRRAPAERFLLAWLVPAWALFELVPTKLPHYVLPLYPALALFAGRALAELPTLAMPRGAAFADRAVAVLWSLATLALALLLVALPMRLGHGMSMAAIGGAALTLVLAGALLVARRRYALAAPLAFAFVATLAAVLPGLDRLWLSRSAAALVARDPPPAGEPLVSVGYSEPSLVFLLGPGTALLTPGNAAAALAHGGRALVGESDRAAFQAALAAGGLLGRAEGAVSGLDYSTGRRLVLTLYAVRPGSR
ncbi:MAG TPA: glycosyltransferase family 39 protein [Stellaceae bacterium]|nr:glycosyltransferase family 39 protein [Stellaceae bacterium]